MRFTTWAKGLTAAGGVVGHIGQYLTTDEDFSYVQPYNPHAKWRYNWDNKDNQYIHAKRREQDKKMTVTKTSKNIILIRHGHSTSEPDECVQELTCLGAQQAELVGERLRRLNYRYRTITFSDNSKKGYQTSKIIYERIKKNIPVSETGLVRTGHPIEPVPEVDDWPNPNSDQVLEDGERMETAFHRYFFRPDADEARNSYDIIVCPANVLRYFVCRVLQFPPEAWRRFTLFHCSITWVIINTDGTINVLNVGDSGHLPPDKLTTEC